MIFCHDTSVVIRGDKDTLKINMMTGLKAIENHVGLDPAERFALITALLPEDKTEIEKIMRTLNRVIQSEDFYKQKEMLSIVSKNGEVDYNLSEISKKEAAQYVKAFLDSKQD